MPAITHGPRKSLVARRTAARRPPPESPMQPVLLGPNIRTLPKVVERHAILVSDDRGDICAEQRAIFRNQMFMQVGGAVVGPIRRGGLRSESGFDSGREPSLGLRKNIQGKLSTSPHEGVVDEDDKPLASQQIAVGPAAVIGLSKRLKRRNRSFRSVRDFLLAIELEVSMVMKGENSRQGSSSTRRFQNPRLSSWPKSNRPGYLFTIDSVGAPWPFNP